MSEYAEVIGFDETLSHPSRDDVDKLMAQIREAISLRVESELSEGAYTRRTLRTESDARVREAEYMIYELIDMGFSSGYGLRDARTF